MVHRKLHRRKRKTIKHRIIMTFLMIIAIPVLLILLTGVFVRGVMLDEWGHDNDNHFNFTPFGLGSDEVARLNKIIIQSPDRLIDTKFLNKIAGEKPYRSAVVFMNGQAVSWTSGISADMIVDIEKFHSYSDDDVLRIKGLKFYRVFSWQFETHRADKAEIMILHRFFRPGELGFRGDLVFILLCILFLIFINILLTWQINKKIIRPLLRLRNAADTIAEGNLDFTLLPRGDREIFELFKAFENMRSRLKKSLEQQLSQERNRKELVAHISHDLRTPMTTIKGYVEGIRDGIADTPEAREKYLEVIHQKTLQLDALIDELFFLSRFDLEGVKTELSRLGLCDFLKSAIKTAQADHPELSIALNCRTDVFILADSHLLQRLFANLFENIYRYNKTDIPEGFVDVELSGDLRKQKVSIKVRDNGPGIADSMVETIFDQFYRADTSRGTLGAGLGLTIAKRIVEAHGGSISASNHPEGGAVFTIILPVEGQ